MTRFPAPLILTLLVCFSPPPVLAQCDSGSDGSDGAFNPPVNVQVDLGLAIPGDALTTPGTGNGVYDAARWVVCFKYSSINLNGGLVTFLKHPSGAPVVWLSQGNVTIFGSVRLNGEDGSQTSILPARGGPGGFDGGISSLFSSPTRGGAGYGPGGASLSTTDSDCGAGGGYSTAGGSAGGLCTGDATGGAAYGSVFCVPLVGGSGGSSSTPPLTSSCVPYSGGGGGGAILIAAGTASTPATIDLTSGSIEANGGQGVGGSGGGSGGTIRLIANTVSGGGVNILFARGGIAGGACILGLQSGGGAFGRIRIDANVVTLPNSSQPPFTTDLVCTAPFPANIPALRVTSVDGQPVSADPIAGITMTDVSINNAGPATINIAATNVPPGTIVKVRVVPLRGLNPGCPAPAMTCDSTPLAGTLASSTATANVTFTPGRTEIQLKANWTP